MSEKKKIILHIPVEKPRNPYALLARQRHAGAHEKPYKTERHQNKQQLKQHIRRSADNNDMDD